MVTTISEHEINQYISEHKYLPNDFDPKLKSKLLCNYFEQEVKTTSGNIYKIIVRQSKVNPLDFSAIFGIQKGGKVFRIKRYNGNSHNHTNKIEKGEIKGFHIHTATERYQNKGFKEEGFAEKTDKYSDWKSALDLLLRENNFIQNKEQKSLFDFKNE